VDGRGNVLKDVDDPNVPSLLSIPLLGYRYVFRIEHGPCHISMAGK
jgi:meiotically up-regulated gene 157 (Mug157) protein